MQRDSFSTLFWLSECTFSQNLALQPQLLPFVYICLRYRLLTRGLVFSISIPAPLHPVTQQPHHVCSHARGLALKDNGCGQLQVLSSRALSLELSKDLSGLWWMAGSCVSPPINKPLAPRWARCPLVLRSPYPHISLPLIISHYVCELFPPIHALNWAIDLLSLACFK